MGDKVDISEVIDLSEDLEEASSEVRSSLKQVIEKVDTIYDMDSFSGKAAKEAKLYFNDVHKMISESFRGLFEELEENLKDHIKNFESDVDSSDSAIITKDYLKDIKEDIIDDYEKLSDEDESISATLKKVDGITSAVTPVFDDLNTWHKHSVKHIKELTGDLSSFTESGDISGTKELLNDIEVAMNNAKTNDGSARFTDYEGNSKGVGLEKLKEYNYERWDQQREDLNAAREERDAAVKNMDDDGKELVNEAVDRLEAEKITKEEYDDILADTKAIYGDGDQDKNISDAMQIFVGEDSIGDNFKNNVIVRYLQDGIEKQGDTLLERGKIVKAMSEQLPENGPPNTLMKNGQKILKYGAWPIKAATAGFAMHDDVFNEGKTPGEATTHTASAIGAGAVGTAVGAFFLASSPVGWAVAGSLAAGAVASWGFEKLYDNNIGGIKTGLDKVGGWIDSINPFS